MPAKTWTDFYTEARTAGMDDANACHQADMAVDGPSDPEVAEAFNRRVQAKAAAGDPAALALVAAFQSETQK